MSKSTIQINHNAFSKITKESAYWAGFLAADGNLRKTHGKYKCVRLYLSIVDLKHLEKFKAFLSSEHKIATPENYERCSFEFCSEQIFDDLYDKYLLTERKSLDLKFPNLPDEVKSSFIRGYFEGDGCICETFSTKHATKTSIITRVIGSPFFMEEYGSIVKSELGIDKLPKLQTHPNGINLALKFNTKVSSRFLNWIYTDSTEETRLDRKYEMYSRLVVNNIRETRVMV